MHTAFIEGFINSPPLWEKDLWGLKQFPMPKVKIAALPPMELRENLRLGHQMERAFHHAIQGSKGYRIVFQNLLVDEGKTRVGELDFILRETDTGHLVHVELAYKFFLIDPGISDRVESLIGPNRRDSLAAKLEKLKNKQLPLLHHSELQRY